MKKRMLFTGGSHSEVPMIEAAQAMGWYVITIGNDEGAMGHQLADRYVKGDFSDKNFILKLAEDERVEAIVSGCNDFAYLSAAYACERLGLPGHDSYETAKMIHTKSSFREMTASIGIKTPKMKICRSKSECVEAMRQIGFPLLVKPVDLTGGKGVRICTESDETLHAFEEAMCITRESYVILEKFVHGTNHGITTLLKAGKVVFHIIDNEQYGENKYLVSGACSPSDIPQHSEFTLIRDIEKIAQHYNLVDGLFHVQFILDDSGYPVMIDPCRRPPGDLYPLLAKYVTGVDYPAEIVKAECGERLKDYYALEHNFIARECIMTSHRGTIQGIHIDNEIMQHLIHKLIKYKEGEEIENPLVYKAGILIMKFSSYEEMQSVLEQYNELVWIELEKT
jgi:biotin carboxylase